MFLIGFSLLVIKLLSVHTYVEIGENVGSSVRAWIIMYYFNHYVIMNTQ